jgi:hypothetical protein
VSKRKAETKVDSKETKKIVEEFPPSGFDHIYFTNLYDKLHVYMFDEKSSKNGKKIVQLFQDYSKMTPKEQANSSQIFPIMIEGKKPHKSDLKNYFQEYEYDDTDERSGSRIILPRVIRELIDLDGYGVWKFFSDPAPFMLKNPSSVTYFHSHYY